MTKQELTPEQLTVLRERARNFLDCGNRETREQLAGDRDALLNHIAWTSGTWSEVLSQHISFDSFADMLTDLHVTMTEAEFAEAKRKLGEYSCSYPTGVLPGKRWLRHDGLFDPNCAPEDRIWALCWYSEPFFNAKGVEQCWVNMLPIRIVEGDEPQSRNLGIIEHRGLTR